METLIPSTTEQNEIVAVMSALENAWNVHDPKTYAALFIEDSDFVNVVGRWMQGKAQIERGHAQVFSGFLSESYLKIEDTKIKLLAPDIAILHCTWEVTGQKSPDGKHSLQSNGVWTAVTVRQEDTWKIAALQNTGRVPLDSSDFDYMR